MRVLVVEDDPMMSKVIESMLKAEGMVVDTTALGEDGLEIGKLYDYDIILLDLMLPDMDGYEVLRRLRSARIETPVLILSGLTEPDKKIKGLGSGADDYLTKPFDKGELVARIQAIVRRSKGHAQSVIDTGKLSVNLDARTVAVSGDPLHLTQILVNLAGNAIKFTEKGSVTLRASVVEDNWSGVLLRFAVEAINYIRL
jgi:two-component system cell cycle response regulator CtrA